MNHASVIHRYFAALDRGDTSVVHELFTPDCVVHRVDVSSPVVGREAVRGLLAASLDLYSSSQTTIHDLFGDDERIAVRLSHNGVQRKDWMSRIGRVYGNGNAASAASMRADRA